jgi:replication fork clamp-binding protein CrfC
MAKVHPLAEAMFVDISDYDLIDAIAHHYSKLKDIEEERKNDPVLAEMQAKVKEYIQDKYGSRMKQHKAKLKAARTQAKARDLQFELPKGL